MTTAAATQIKVAANKVTEITVTAGQSLAVEGAAVQNMTLGKDGALVVAFEGGGTLIIRNFAEVSAMQPSPTLALSNGQSIVLSQFQPYTFAPVKTAEAAAETVIAKPKAGETAVVKLAQGEAYELGFAPDAVKSVENKGGQLVIAFKDGGEIIIPNYGTAGKGTQLAFADGEILGLVAETQGITNAQMAKADAQLAQNLAEIEPAAGEAGGGAGAGGFGFQSTFQAAPLESLDPIGPIDPTALQYQAPDFVPEVVLKDDPIIPSIEVADVWVKEDGSVALTIEAAPQNGNQQITLTITGFDPGWAVDTAASGGTYDPATLTWTITLNPGQAFSGGPTVFPPANSDFDMTGLNVTSDVTDVSTGKSASIDADFNVFTDAVADVPNLAATAGPGLEDTPVALNITTSPADPDGSEAITKVIISGVPVGATLNNGTLVSPGTYELTPAELAGLQLNPPANWSGNIALTVTSIVNEVNLAGLENDLLDNQQQAQTQLLVRIEGVADKPDVSAKDVLVKEDGSIQLVVEANLNDTDGSEVLTVTISGIDPTWGVDPNGGSYDAATGTWTFNVPNGTYAFTGGPIVSPSANSDLDMKNLTVTATAKELIGGSTATASAGFGVTTDAVVDPITVDAANATGKEGAGIPVVITIGGSVDTDGSEAISNITISGLPTGFTLNNGAPQPDGSYILTPAQLTGLEIKGPAFFHGTIGLTVTVTNTDTPNDDEFNPNDNDYTVADEFTVTFDPVPHTPTVCVEDIQIKEDGSKQLIIDAQLSGPATDILTVTITGIAAGWGVNTAQSGGTYTESTGTWTITLDPGQNYTGKGPVFSPPADSDADLVNLLVTATEKGALTASATDTASIFVDAVIDGPTLTAAANPGTEDAAIPLTVTIGKGGDILDGSEVLSPLTVSGVPSGATLSLGTQTAPGVWTIPAGTDITGLAITPPANFSGNFNLTFSVTDTETNLSGVEWDTLDNSKTVTADLNVVVKPDADKPDITVKDAYVKEDGTVQLELSASLKDTDGSETLTVSISGIGSGWGVNTAASGGTYNSTTGVWTLNVTGSTFTGGPVLSPPANSDADLNNLTFTATAREGGNGDTESAAANFSVFTDAVIDGPSITATAPGVAEGAAIPLTITVGRGGDTLDGSEVLSKVTISGVPAGATLSKGTEIAPGVWEIASDNLANLTLTPAPHYTGNVTLTVSVTDTETNLSGLEWDTTDNSKTATATLEICIDNTIDKPLVSAQDVFVDEDGSIALKISASLVNPGPNDTLTVSISGIDSGWDVNPALSGGTYDETTGIWTLTLPAGVTSFTGGPTVSPPANSDVDMTGLVVTATASDGIVSASAIATENVFTNAVIDGPSVSASNASGSDNGPIALSINVGRGGDVPNATDNSEEITGITLTLTGAPAGTTLSHGQKQTDGTWKLEMSDLANLKVQTPKGFEGTFDIVIKVTEEEKNLSGVESNLNDNKASATATLRVTVGDDEPVIVNPSAKILDETNLASGNLTATDTVGANFFGDAPGTITAQGVSSFSAGGSLKNGALTSNGVPVAVTLLGNTYTGTAGGKEIFTLSIQSGGQYVFTLKGALDHANASDPNDQILLNFGVTATDSDGDSANASIQIRVLDDAPAAYNDVNTWVTASSGASGNVVTGLNGGANAADVTGQDKPGAVTEVAFKGVPVAVSQTGQTTVEGDYGTLKISANGSYTYTLKGAASAYAGAAKTLSDDFVYTLKDADGDSSTAHLNISGQPPVFIVGKNVNDKDGSSTDYQVGTGKGAISGGNGPDILVGDVGGAETVKQVKDYNIVLILDVSSSMQGDKIALLKSAVNNLLTSFHNYTGGAVKVHVVIFAQETMSQMTVNVNGADQTGFNAVKNFVNSFTANGYTNYEDPLADAVTWLKSTGANAPLQNADTYSYFVSDGDPNHIVNSSGRIEFTDAATVMAQIQGSDGSNEVAQIQSLSTQVIGVGIGVGPETIARLDVIDSTVSGALDVKNPADLNAALQDASPLNQITAVGNDTITGGSGSELIFGDSLNTDVLATAQGLSTAKGAGWDVFAKLEAGEGANAGWTRADTINYIKAHAAELAAESLDSKGGGRAGGHDTLSGGAGDDVIYGQEGNDWIDGGSGNNVLDGGSGADTFHIGHAPGAGVDTIKGFSATGGDVLDVGDILVGFDPLSDSLHDFVKVVNAGGSTLVQVDATGTGAAYQTVAVLEGVTIDFDTLTNHGNLVA